ncbi:hypothetical protein [Paracoccus alkanivorans]|nr:hypothetical protein [Paracoccus alkanivorans]
MSKLLNYLLYRFYRARSVRALNLHHRFKSTAEKFFRRGGFDWDERE